MVLKVRVRVRVKVWVQELVLFFQEQELVGFLSWVQAMEFVREHFKKDLYCPLKIIDFQIERR